MFLAFLIFDPNWTFCKNCSLCMGYSLCKMAILKIVSFLEYLLFFRAVFCTEQLQCSSSMVFDMFLAFLIFDPNWPFCKGYCVSKMADFKNCLISRIFAVFRAVFCTEQLQYSCRIVFRMFLAFLLFNPNWPFCKGYSFCMGYSLCKMANFQNRLISRIFGVFSSGFLHRTTLIFL